MKEASILLTLWPPVQSDWNKIAGIVGSIFEIKKVETYRYVGNDWINFIIRLYYLCYEEFEHYRYPNIPKMIPKAEYMGRFSKDICLLEIKVNNPDFQTYKNGNPYGLLEVKKMKDDIRLLYQNKIPRFSVIHSFDTPVRNNSIVSLLAAECQKV